MSRLLSNWLDAYKEYTLNTEPPALYHLWAGVSVLSAALGRKCYMHRGHYTLYPNFYVVLIGESAMLHKTTAAEMAIEIFDASEIGNLFRADVTKAGLSAHLGELYKSTGSSSIFIYSFELINLLGPDCYASGILGYITALYDGKTMNKITKTAGSDEVKNVYSVMLGCATPGWLATMPPSMLEGGFSGRVIFAAQEEPDCEGIPFPEDVVDEVNRASLKGKLIHDLQEIASIEGKYVVDKRGKNLYRDWYMDYFKSRPDDIKMRPYYGRKGDHVLKLAMILHACYDDSTIVTDKDIWTALDMLATIEEYMPLAFQDTGESKENKHYNKIKKAIQRFGKTGITQSLLTKKMSSYYTSDQLYDGPVKTMIVGNEVEQYQNGSVTYYKWIGDN